MLYMYDSSTHVHVSNNTCIHVSQNTFTCTTQYIKLHHACSKCSKLMLKNLYHYNSFNGHYCMSKIIQSVTMMIPQNAIVKRLVFELTNQLILLNIQ